MKTKFQVGGFRYPVEMEVKGGSIYVKFAFNRNLINEVKSMSGARWDPDNKQWHFTDNQRNRFQLAYLQGENPYARYDTPLDLSNIPKTRFNTAKNCFVSLFSHQPEGVAHILQRRNSIIAGEMGTAKSLMAIMAMELAPQIGEYWYIAPKSGLYAVERELRIWNCKVKPRMMTYEGLVKAMKNWIPGAKAPFFVVFDEASKIKNPTAQRSQAAKSLADGVRADWGDSAYITLMSGSPAPKSPADWYSLCEIACPGFIKEGDIHKFKRRLGIIIMKESIDRGVYPQLVTWRDSESKCDICGLTADMPVHHPEMAIVNETHDFKPSVNEVKKLYERLKGLTVVYFKKNCLDLPDKHYRQIELKPTGSILRAASLIAKGAKTTIQGLTLLRELSDGFQYKDTAVGHKQCSVCKGSKVILAPREIPGTCPNCTDPITCGQHIPQVEQIEQSCPNCGGAGEVTTYERTIVEVPCPKDDALGDILEEHEDVGRLVIFAGFTGSIDRCVRICQKRGWSVIRMDQGKIRIIDPMGQVIQHDDFQSMFQDELEKYNKVAFVAHPKSGGMGLTLTASPSSVYFSNTFDAEDRIQSEDRIHRPGMDLNRGATIYDLIHLPSDVKILENLKRKRDLQAMTLGDFYSVSQEELLERTH